jgi:hypothetical protein
LTSALRLPVNPDAAFVLSIVDPQAWQQTNDWLEKLEAEKIITPEEKEEQQAKIDALRDQEKWFSHESLHATDTLKEQLQREIGNMARGPGTAPLT